MGAKPLTALRAGTSGWQRRLGILLVLALVATTGCSPIGPATIARDRFDYTTAVAESWKRQMLHNIVKIRYGDVPVFLDVTSITNQYSLERELRGTLGWASPPSSNRQELAGTGRYYDRPTITYNLLTGEKFARSLMTPIAPATVMALVEGGYPIDLVFRLTVHSVNGVRNQFGGSARTLQADAEFYPLLEKLREIQSSGAVALRVAKLEGGAAVIMTFRQRDAKDLAQRVVEVRQILGLPEEAREFPVVYGSAPAHSGEIALLTRSIIEILSDLSSTIDVPDEHVADHRVIASMAEEGEGVRKPLIRIRSSAEAPGDGDAFVAVPYGNHWFWIDDRDYASKRLFSFLMFVMTLTESGGKDGAPVLTISAGG
jgi:hypothetical protein